MTVHSWIRAFREPIPAERLRINRSRRPSFPVSAEAVQVAGIAHHSCGATQGVMERCDFACTSCYLGSQANATPPLPEAEVFSQLDALRAFLGPQGKAQLTSGEVTLLPRDSLGRFVRYAKRIGLDPMVMTHGQRLLEEPDYLEDLVAEDGLEKISIHIDVTQRGRKDWRPGLSESELHPLRERYAELIRRTRKTTGRTLHAAHTVTVTHQNFDDVASVARWVAHNADAFRMLSFQPVAEVGRTQDRRLEELTLDRVWERICEGLGQSLNRDAMHFGHPECNIVIPLVVLSIGERMLILETARAGKAWDRSYLDRLMHALGGFTVRGKTVWETVIGFLSLCLRHPRLLLETPLYAAYRLPGPLAWLLGGLGQLLRGRALRIRPLALVVHKFMSPDEIDTPLGRERLAACTFQVPVGDRIIPMCELNATGLRAELNESLRSAQRIDNSDAAESDESSVVGPDLSSAVVEDGKGDLQVEDPASGDAAALG